MNAHRIVITVTAVAVIALTAAAHASRPSEDTSGSAMPVATTGVERFRYSITGSVDSEQQFSVTYGTEGRFAEVPFAISYQPHWWIQIDLVLDATADVRPLVDGRLP
jgi:hypothetical protein